MFIWCEIVCRECSGTTAGRFVTGQIPKREMENEAKAAGWIFKYGESYYSKYCLKRFEDGQKSEN